MKDIKKGVIFLRIANTATKKCQVRIMQGNSERGISLVTTMIVLPIMLYSLVSAIDTMMLLTNRYITLSTFNNLVNYYQQDPTNVDLQEFTKNAGMGWLNFNGSGNCITVTAHASQSEAENASKHNDCDTPSVTSMETDKPYLSVTAQHRFKPIASASAFISNANLDSGSYKDLRFSQVMQANLINCASGQALLADGAGGIKCTNDIDEIWEAVADILGELNAAQGRINDVNDKVDQYRGMINGRIDDSSEGLDELNDKLKQLNDYVKAEMLNLQNMLTSVTQEISNLENVSNDQWNQINQLWQQNQSQWNYISSFWNSVNYINSQRQPLYDHILWLNTQMHNLAYSKHHKEYAESDWFGGKQNGKNGQVQRNCWGGWYMVGMYHQNDASEIGFHREDEAFKLICSYF